MSNGKAFALRVCQSSALCVTYIDADPQGLACDNLKMKQLSCIYFLKLVMCLPTPPLLENKGLRTNNTTRVFHCKVITSQDLMICVSILNVRNIALANMDCEGFSFPHSFIFYPDIIFTLFSIPFILRFRIIIRKELCNMVIY